ncbi:DUF7373 family lipoprotein [Nocardia alni]|uniref:DUF7373 family lipoprotein n=1 Tax=Nocardia alni TaxID=2815723 RepID=UPI001C238492|nr:hypothetical protein [Nocardia alni]
MRRGTIALAVGLAAVLAAITGCGSGSHSTASPPPVDVSKLDVGGYTIIPHHQGGKPTLERAELSEGQRLASYLPLPMDIDPQFRYQDGTNPMTVRGFLNGAEDAGLATDDINSIAPGFVAGFNVGGYSDPDIIIASVLRYSVMIFTDDKAASDGAAALAKIQFAHDPQNQPTAIDGHPDAHSFWRSGEDTIETFTSSGQYVIYSKAYDTAMPQINSNDLAAISALTKKTIEDIVPSLSGFKITPISQLPDVPLNHDMADRAVPQTNGDVNNDYPGIYTQRGALMLSDHPATDRDLYTRTGMDSMVLNAGRLYRTRDAEAASELLDARSVVPRMYKTADPPPNLSEAHCDEYKGSSSDGIARFHCTVAYDRYVAEMWSEQLIDVHQRIAAQYALLATS